MLSVLALMFERSGEVLNVKAKRVREPPFFQGHDYQEVFLYRVHKEYAEASQAVLQGPALFLTKWGPAHRCQPAHDCNCPYLHVVQGPTCQSRDALLRAKCVCRVGGGCENETRPFMASVSTRPCHYCFGQMRELRGYQCGKTWVNAWWDSIQASCMEDLQPVSKAISCNPALQPAEHILQAQAALCF
eukprot:jgi/Botrbrau1/12032/Bobra.0293s0009.1